jgi:tetratricopeptide (TPR) repeat protein
MSLMRRHFNRFIAALLCTTLLLDPAWSHAFQPVPPSAPLGVSSSFTSQALVGAVTNVISYPLSTGKIWVDRLLGDIDEFSFEPEWAVVNGPMLMSRRNRNKRIHSRPSPTVSPPPPVPAPPDPKKESRWSRISNISGTIVRLFGASIALVLFGLAAFILVTAFTSPQPIIIEPIVSLPPAITQSGQNTEGFRSAVIQNILRIEQDADPTHASSGVTIRQELLDFQVPATNLTIAKAHEIIQKTTRTEPTRIHLSITSRTDEVTGQIVPHVYRVIMVIRSRKPGFPSKPVEGEIRAMTGPSLELQLSRWMLEVIDPYFLARLAFEKHDNEEARERAEKMILTGRDLLWGHYLMGRIYQFGLEADDHFKKSLEIDETFVPALLGRGGVLSYGGRYKAAIAEFQKALAIEPANAIVLTSIGKTLAADDRFDEAVDYYKRAIAADPTYLEPYDQLYHLRTIKGRAAEAIAYFKELIQKNPRDATTHYALGEAYKSEKRTAEAFQEYKKALELDPEFTEAYRGYHETNETQKYGDFDPKPYQRALQFLPHEPKMYIQADEILNRFDQVHLTIAWFQEVVRAHPHNPVARNELGHALAKQGRYRDAIAAYREALILDPEYVSEHQQRASFWHDDLKRTAESDALFQMILEVRPDYGNAHLSWGYQLMKTGNRTRARALIKRAIELNVTLMESYLSTADHLRLEKKYAQAMWAFQLLAEVYQNKPDIYEGMAQTMMDQRRYEDAARYYEKAIEADVQSVDPQRGENYYKWGSALLQAGQPAQAFSPLTTALEINPTLKGIRKFLADTLRRRHLYKEAAAYYEGATVEEPESAELYRNWAIILDKLGKPVEAEEKRQKARELERKKSSSKPENSPSARTTPSAPAVATSFWSPLLAGMIWPFRRWRSPIKPSRFRRRLSQAA